MSKIKYLLYGISIIVFILLNFVLETKIQKIINEILASSTDTYFTVSINTYDFLVFSAIPIFGILYNSKKVKFNVLTLLQGLIKLLISVLLVFGIGLYALVFINKSTNPLIPQNLIIEPFNFYSVLLIIAGIAIPFIFQSLNKTQKN